MVCIEMASNSVADIWLTDEGGVLDHVPESLWRLVRVDHRLEQEEVFELLYNPRRRYTLELMVGRARPFSMTELVECIAAEENDVPIGELERQQRRRVHVSLYQTHLPLLDEAGAIEYDRRADRIVPGPGIRELTPYLDTGPTTTIPWRQYYGWLLAGATGLSVFALAAPIGLSLSALAFCVSMLFLALALVQEVVTGSNTSVIGVLMAS